MTEKILLISINQCAIPYPVYPLGMSHVAASLRRYGHEVTLADLRYDDERIELIVRERQPRFIGLSLRNIDDHRIDDTVYFVPVLLAAARRIRRITDAVIVLGGSAYSLFPEELLVGSEADFGIVGEGDEALPRLIALMSMGDELTSVPGLVYRNEGTVRRNQVAAVPGKNILSPYRPDDLFGVYLTDSGTANLQTQRGCPFTCCYCTYPLIEGTRIRMRDPQEVAQEAAVLETQGARYFFIVDSVFNVDNDHVAAVCEAFIRQGVRATWGCFLRPKNIGGELMELMARAGLRHIEFGTDSLCDEVLVAYGKQFTVDDIVTVDNLADSCGVRHAHFLICGGPGETEETLEMSYENSRRLRKTAIFPFVGMRLYPGTALYRHALGEGVISASTDLLQPYFYVTEKLPKERITAILESFHERSPRWVIKDPSPEQQKIIERLRSKNIVGPLWEFLAQ
ncbi:MAG: cobalamin-dependent protein [Chitinispirillaceae bacterium]|nr:cobalamin-dependent protein [Chitinispirillaceae bacterium]